MCQPKSRLTKEVCSGSGTTSLKVKSDRVVVVVEVDGLDDLYNALQSTKPQSPLPSLEQRKRGKTT
jgi:hypothetical protein